MNSRLNSIEHTRIYGEHAKRRAPEFYARPGRATQALPGTAEKKLVLAARVENGEELFETGDPDCFEEFGIGRSFANLIFPSQV